MNKLLRELSNGIGSLLREKLVVIESDDWGSIRMPSKQVYESLKSKGLNLGKGETERYNKFDTLASPQDLEELFDVLSSVKDLAGRNPVFTAVSLVANPDFKQIKDHDFTEYFWEPLSTTFADYDSSRSLDLWVKGKQMGYFHPEFHGREHVNVAAWIRALRNKDDQTLFAFEQGCWGFKREAGIVNFQAAFDLEEPSDLEQQKSIITDGLAEFERIHGYKARFFVPPNGPFNNELQKAAHLGGIKYLSTAKIQQEPRGNGVYKKRYHYLGQKSKYGLRYLTRNAFFEPSAEGKDWVDSCLSEIESAFRWRKPAVISTHRVNYIGVHDPKNRERGLKQLSELLSKIVKNWPDVHFITSTELGDLIATKK